MPRFGLIVVNGYGAISAGARVAEAKNVDLPTFGFPTTPISMSVHGGLLRSKIKSFAVDCAGLFFRNACSLMPCDTAHAASMTMEVMANPRTMKLA